MVQSWLSHRYGKARPVRGFRLSDKNPAEAEESMIILGQHY